MFLPKQAYIILYYSQDLFLLARTIEVPASVL